MSFPLSLELMITQQTTQFKLCTRDYITKCILLEDSFSFLKTSWLILVFLECILWEWSGKIFLLLNSNPVALKCKLREWYEVKWKSLRHVPLFVTPWNIQSTDFSRPETGETSLSLPLLWGIFPTQGSNPGLLHCRWILYQLSHKGSPKSGVEMKKLGVGR